MTRFYTYFTHRFVSRMMLLILLIIVSMIFFSFKSYAGTDAVKVDGHLRLVVKGNVYSDETIIRYNAAATNGFDLDYDAYKIMSSGTTPSLYLVTGGTNYSINSFAQPSAMPVLDVFLKVLEDGIYTMTIVNNASENYILYDKKLGVSHPVNGTVYSFLANRSDAFNRFELRLVVPATLVSITTGVHSNTNASAVQVFSSDGGIVIKTDQFVGQACVVKVIDLNGVCVKIFGSELLGTTSTFLKLNLPMGVYVVQLKVDSTDFSGQVLLKGN